MVGRPTQPHGNAEQRSHLNGSYVASAVAATEGEAGAATAENHGTHAGIWRHRRVNHEPLCDACRDFDRAYRLEYERLRRSIPAERARRAEANRRWRERNRETLRVAERDRYHRNRAALAADARVDEIAVERAIHGEPVRLNRDEKRAALRQLMDRGLTLSAAAQQLGISGQYARKYAGVA